MYFSSAQALSNELLGEADRLGIPIDRVAAPVYAEDLSGGGAGAGPRVLGGFMSTQHCITMQEKLPPAPAGEIAHQLPLLLWSDGTKVDESGERNIWALAACLAGAPSELTRLPVSGSTLCALVPEVPGVDKKGRVLSEQQRRLLQYATEEAVLLGFLSELKAPLPFKSRYLPRGPAYITLAAWTVDLEEYHRRLGLRTGTPPHLFNVKPEQFWTPAAYLDENHNPRELPNMGEWKAALRKAISRAQARGGDMYLSTKELAALSPDFPISSLAVQLLALGGRLALIDPYTAADDLPAFCFDTRIHITAAERQHNRLLGMAKHVLNAELEYYLDPDGGIDTVNQRGSLFRRFASSRVADVAFPIRFFSANQPRRLATSFSKYLGGMQRAMDLGFVGLVPTAIHAFNVKWAQLGYLEDKLSMLEEEAVALAEEKRQLAAALEAVLHGGSGATRRWHAPRAIPKAVGYNLTTWIWRELAGPARLDTGPFESLMISCKSSFAGTNKQQGPGQSQSLAQQLSLLEAAVRSKDRKGFVLAEPAVGGFFFTSAGRRQPWTLSDLLEPSAALLERFKGLPDGGRFLGKDLWNFLERHAPGTARGDLPVYLHSGARWEEVGQRFRTLKDWSYIYSDACVMGRHVYCQLHDCVLVRDRTPEELQDESKGKVLGPGALEVLGLSVVTEAEGETCGLLEVLLVLSVNLGTAAEPKILEVVYGREMERAAPYFTKPEYLRYVKFKKVQGRRPKNPAEVRDFVCRVVPRAELLRLAPVTPLFRKETDKGLDLRRWDAGGKRAVFDAAKEPSTWVLAPTLFGSTPFEDLASRDVPVFKGAAPRGKIRKKSARALEIDYDEEEEDGDEEDEQGGELEEEDDEDDGRARAAAEAAAGREEAEGADEEEDE
jgi:hypothetical protein